MLKLQLFYFCWILDFNWNVSKTAVLCVFPLIRVHAKIKTQSFNRTYQNVGVEFHGFKKSLRLEGSLVVPLGFEPRAAGLENLCSIQLSYGTKMLRNRVKAQFFKYAKVKKEII